MKNWLILALYLSLNFTANGMGTSSSHYENISKNWLKLLYYKKNDNGYESTAEGPYFFISKEGRISPKIEWSKSLNAIKEDLKVGRLKNKFKCVFPARYKLITGRSDFTSCTDLNEWRDAIGAKELFLVYASSYVSNPASMFGHSFLRLSRGGKKRSDALLDYSIGFMALTNSQDNSLSYAVKGMTGQYFGHFDVKPFYQNVGLYQNSEDRDLWQYQIKLSKEKVDLLVDHMWEVSMNAVFKYYFFDENCSFYLLKVLEAINADWNVLDHSYIFAHPIETLKWMKEKIDKTKTQHLTSINTVLRSRLAKMSASEREQFRESQKSIEALEKVRSVNVLDALIDYWKFENYSNNTDLKKSEKTLMDTALLLRSEQGRSEFLYKAKHEKIQDPSLFHDPNKIEVLYSDVNGESEYGLNLYLGYHDLDDNYLGHDNISYIDYFGVDCVFKEKELNLKQIKIVSIQSIAPYLLSLPQFSWAFDLSYRHEDNLFERSNVMLKPSLGMSFFKGTDFLSVMINLDTKFWSTQNISGVYLIPSFSLISKNLFNSFSIVQEVDSNLIKKDMKVSYRVRLNYFSSGNLSEFIEFKNDVGISDFLRFNIGMRANF